MTKFEEALQRLVQSLQREETQADFALAGPAL